MTSLKKVSVPASFWPGTETSRAREPLEPKNERITNDILQKRLRGFRTRGPRLRGFRTGGPPVATLSWGMRVHARGKKRKQREARKGEAAGRGDAPRACCARPAALAHGATHRPSEPSRRDGALCSLPRSRSLGCKPTLCEGREGRRRRRRWAPERRRAATARTAAGAGERRARRRRRARRGRSTAAAAARAS